MTDTYDPTAILREGKRTSEIRYVSEALYRRWLEDNPNANFELLASKAIQAACMFEQQWAIATLGMHEEEDFPLLTTEKDLVAAILEEQEL